jgi:hypothetical protein
MEPQILRKGAREEKPSLGIQGVQNSLDYLNEVAKQCDYRFAMRDLDIVKSYVQSKIHPVLKLVSNDESADFDLVFRPIPLRPNRNADDAPFAFEVAQERSAADGEHGVLISNSYLIECPEGVVTSSVWLDLPKERANFDRNILAPSSHVVLEFSGTSGERESGTSGFRLSADNRNAVAGNVKRGTQVVGSLFGKAGDAVWEWFLKPDFVDLMLRVIRVKLRHNGVWACLEKDSRFNFKISDVLLCASDFTA